MTIIGTAPPSGHLPSNFLYESMMAVRLDVSPRALPNNSSIPSAMSWETPTLTASPRGREKDIFPCSALFATNLPAASNFSLQSTASWRRTRAMSEGVVTLSPRQFTTIMGSIVGPWREPRCFSSACKRCKQSQQGRVAVVGAVGCGDDAAVCDSGCEKQLTVFPEFGGPVSTVTLVGLDASIFQSCRVSRSRLKKPESQKSASEKGGVPAEGGQEGSPPASAPGVAHTRTTRPPRVDSVQGRAQAQSPPRAWATDPGERSQGEAEVETRVARALKGGKAPLEEAPASPDRGAGSRAPRPATPEVQRARRVWLEFCGLGGSNSAAARSEAACSAMGTA